MLRSFQKGEKRGKEYKHVLKKLARLHVKIANQQRDWFYKLSRELCKRYSIICIEDLNMKAMQMHKNWGRKVSDLAYSEFVSILKSAVKKFGTRVVRVSRFFSNTRTSDEYGHVNA